MFADGDAVSRDDTVPSAQDFRTQFLRSLSGFQRVELVLEMNATADALSSAGIRARHPEYTPHQVHRALVRLILGDQLFREACPSEVLLDP